MSRAYKFRSRLSLNALDRRDVPSTTLVKDINPRLFAPLGSNPEGGAVFQGKFYFSADDGVYGNELWRTDGTAAGTELVADMRNGSNGSYPDNFAVFNGKLYFSADQGVVGGAVEYGRELYAYDGSGQPNVVSDLNFGSADSSPAQLTVVNNTLYFVATAGAGAELYKLDANGSPVMLKDIGIDPSIAGPQRLTDVNGTLFFIAQDSFTNFELWKSNGTAAGTVKIKEIYAGADGSDPADLTAMNGKVYFVASNPTSGRELWVSDGSAAGTMLVKDIVPGSGDSGIDWLTAVNNTLYFSATTAGTGSELWKSDGTAAGTVMVKDINPGATSSNPYALTNLNGTLLFSAKDGVHGYELWKSDGTAAGTAMVKDLTPGAGDSEFSLQFFTNLNGTLYCSTGHKIWKSDGTEAGTTVDKDFGQNGYSGTLVGAMNGALFVSAQASAAQGSELWMTTATRPIHRVVVGADAGQLPQVRVYDADTGNVEMNLFAYDPSFKGGVRVAVGDVTGDGVDDIITAAGAGGGPHVRVFDGVTGTAKKEFFAYDASFKGGVFVAVGDFNNDGYADIVTGAGAGGGPHVKVINGSTLQTITEFFAFNANFHGGVNVGTGDVNADGYSDLIFAAGPGGGPHVRVISGKDDATELRSFFAYDAAFDGGVNVATGDLNGDGYDDLIVSQATKGNRIHTYNGKDNALLNDFTVGKAGYTGGVRVAAADANRNGLDDLFSFTNDSNSVMSIYSRDGGNPSTPFPRVITTDPGFLGGVFVGV